MPETVNSGSIYAAFMQEIKQRLDDVRSRLRLIHHEPNASSAIFDAELTYLQIRFVCELTALASLSAHNSYGLGKDLLRAYHADDIFTQLTEINAFCFPVPVKATVGADGIPHFVVEEEGRLNRARLKEIYGQCGNALHRGRLKHALSGKHKIYNLGQIVEWQSALVALLSQHLILFPQENRVLLVNLDGDGDGRVKVIQAEADGPFWVDQTYQG